jgi:ATP-dependent RNA helicase RhlE
MLDMGFIRDIRRILPLLPKKRQNLLFSATFSDEIRQLARGFLHDPAEISVSPRNTAAQTVSQTIIPVDKGKKPALLCKLIQDKNLYQALVFSRTKHGANKLVEFLEKQGITAGAIHGNKSQNHRTKVLADFKAGKLQILVATDIAARGIDISQLPHVINFDLPHVPEDYVHRIGRTGRAGAEGEAFSLVCDEEVDMLRGIEKLIGKTIPRQEIEGFELSAPLPKFAPKTAAPSRGRGNSGRNGDRNRGERGQGDRSGGANNSGRPARSGNGGNSRRGGGQNGNRARASAD